MFLDFSVDKEVVELVSVWMMDKEHKVILGNWYIHQNFVAVDIQMCVLQNTHTKYH